MALYVHAQLLRLQEHVQVVGYQDDVAFAFLSGKTLRGHYYAVVGVLGAETLWQGKVGIERHYAQDATVFKAHTVGERLAM